MPVDKDATKTCQCGNTEGVMGFLNKIFSDPPTSIEVKYVTVQFERLRNEEYAVNFMQELKGQLCCLECEIPWMIVEFDNGEKAKVSKKSGLNMTLIDIQEQLDGFRQMILEDDANATRYREKNKVRSKGKVNRKENGRGKKKEK